MDLINEIDTRLYNKKGKINGAITRREWFQQSDLNKIILEKTTFLPAETTLYSERVYCIKNNITSRRLCPISGNPLRFDSIKNQYSSVSGSNNNGKLGVKKEDSIKRGITKSNTHKQKEQALIDIYRNKKFNIIEKDKILNFINRRIIDTDTGRKEGFINDKLRSLEVDMLCSILHYTEHPILNTLTDKIDWSERFYLLINNTTPPISFTTNKKIKYLTFTKGYYVHHKKIDRFTPLIRDTIETQGFEILNTEEQLTVEKTIFTLKCKKCSKTFSKTLTCNRWKDIYCPGCYGDIGISRLEKEICTFLTLNNINFQENVKNILDAGELDIYISAKNIAIEVNGILWHSFGTNYPNNINNETKNKFRHHIKTIECQNKGIQLIHIWDSEWNLKQDIVKSLILSKLNIFQTKIYARKCEIRSVINSDKTIFLRHNHLQGDCRSTYNYGLYYNNELVSIMTFGTRSITGGEPKVELLRFCNKINSQIVGGASRLFKHFIKENNVTNIISYANKRYSNGNLYKKIGFILKHESLPNYWYTKNYKELIHRTKFQKHKLNKILDKFDNSLTESENMYNAGYRKIYDCGNYVFEWER